ncbi:MAG: hypothetical protein NDI93_01910 [Pseudomonas sp.]|nr:hypothetical protein [Pseudomonas sp.]
MAKATTRAAATSATKGAPEPLEGLFVRSLAPTFRRAGFEFTREGHGLLLADLSEEQIKAIETEPLLSVTYCEFPATAEADALLAEQAAEGAKDPASAEGEA